MASDIVVSPDYLGKSVQHAYETWSAPVSFP